MIRARTGRVFVGSLLAFAACPGAPAPVVEKKSEVVEVVKAEMKAEVKPEPVKPVEPVEPVAAPVVAAVKPGLAAEQFMFVFRGDVALAPSAEEGWGIGKVAVRKTKDGLEGGREVDATKLPEPLRKLDGAAVTLYGASGKVCEATLKGRRLYGLSERGDEEVPEGELPSMPALMAGLADRKGTCTGASWARRSELPAPVVFVKEKADAALVTKARAATEKLAAYATTATSYAEYARDSGDRVTWAKFAAKQFRATVWAEAGGRKLVLTEVGDVENVRCEANFTERVAAVFELEGGALRVLSETGPWQPDALFDANGDGEIEVLVTPPGGLGGILTTVARGDGEPVSELRFPSEGLGCADGMEDEP